MPHSTDPAKTCSFPQLLHLKSSNLLHFVGKYLCKPLNCQKRSV